MLLGLAPCWPRGQGIKSQPLSVDEATSLQAIERNAPDKPVAAGGVAKQEFEYTRHGTTTLTAGLDVVTGTIVCPTLEATRTERVQSPQHQTFSKKSSFRKPESGRTGP